jgi:hypothetical protein
LIQRVTKRCKRLRLLAAFPEWEVSLEGGETASHTDVLALTSVTNKGLCVLAVEAKVNEDFGPLLKDKRAEASAGQGQRLDYLHSLLGVSHFDDLIRYQLLHRTASALLTAREFHAQAAVMLVHSFGDKPNLRADFDSLLQRARRKAVCHSECMSLPRSAVRVCTWLGVAAIASTSMSSCPAPSNKGLLAPSYVAAPFHMFYFLPIQDTLETPNPDGGS